MAGSSCKVPLLTWPLAVERAQALQDFLFSSFISLRAFYPSEFDMAFSPSMVVKQARC